MPNNVRRLRDALGLKQDEAAAQVGTTRNQWVKLEHGSRRLSLPWIERIAAAWNIDPGELVAQTPFSERAKELQDEIERLRSLSLKNDEHHASIIRELAAEHEKRITRFVQRIRELEMELARKNETIVPSHPH